MNIKAFAIIGCIVLLAMVSPLRAQRLYDSLPYVNYELVEAIKYPMLTFNNPASIHSISVGNITEISTIYKNVQGEYKPLFEPANSNDIAFSTKSINKFKHITLSGEFAFNRSLKKQINFTNISNSYSGTPYLFIDTVGGDNFDTEQYHLKAIAAYEMSEKIYIGCGVIYNAALGAQTRDPRSQTNMVNLTVNAGVIYKPVQKLKIGAGLNFFYKNEDIDIKTIEQNTSYFLFGYTGLGTYTKHSAETFYRLYEQKKPGGNFQIEYGNHLFNIDYSQFVENVFDGRKEGEAVWSAMKHDSEFRNRTIGCDYVFTLQANESIHSLKASAVISESVGAEVLQNLNKLNEGYNIYQWQTISIEDKYFRKCKSALVSYEIVKLNNTLHKYMCKSFVRYEQSEENYYLPNQKLMHENIYTDIEASRYFVFEHSGVNVQLNIGYMYNISNEINLSYNTFLIQKIVEPDFEYFSSNYYRFGADITFDFSINERGRYYWGVQSRGVFSSVNYNSNRLLLTFLLGVLF